MGISSAGMGSGLDINGLVDKLVNIESQPLLKSIQRDQSAVQTRLSALGTLKNTLSFLQAQIASLGTTALYHTNKVSSSDPSTISASSNTDAIPGAYTMQVTQLAKAQKSMSTNEYASADSVIGTGTITLTSGSGATFTAAVGGTGTLTNIRDAINQASNNFGVQASIVNVDSLVTPGTTISKLVLTATKTGISNGFSLSGTPAIALSTVNPAQNAIIVMDGQTATRSTNVISDVAPGIVLTLQKENPGTNIQINIDKDQTVVTNALNNFVSNYNAWTKAMNDLTNVGTSSADRGPLADESSLRSLLSNIRSQLSQPVSGTSSSSNTLAMIGINIDKNGVMTLSSDKINQVMASNPDAIQTIFSSSTDGIIKRINNAFTPFLQVNGNIANEEGLLNTKYDALEKKLSVIQTRMDNLHNSLLSRFTSMDIVVAKYQSIGTMLTNAFQPKKVD